MSDALAITENARLEKLEVTIERGLGNFVEVGTALLEIRDSRLYRETHDSFETYCRERWEMSRQNAHELIGAAEVAINVSGAPDTSTTISVAQARPLSKFDAEAQRALFAEAQQKAAAEGKPVATRHVKAAVAKRNGTAAEPEPPPHAPEPGPGEAPFDPDDDKNGLVYCNGVRWRVDATPDERKQIMRDNWADWTDEDRSGFLDDIIQNYRLLFIAAIARSK